MPLRTAAGAVGCVIGAGLKKLTDVVDALDTTVGVCCAGVGFEKLTFVVPGPVGFGRGAVEGVTVTFIESPAVWVPLTVTSDVHGNGAVPPGATVASTALCPDGIVALV